MIAYFDGHTGVSLPKWAFQISFAELTNWTVKPWEVDDLPVFWMIRLAEYYRLRKKLIG